MIFMAHKIIGIAWAQVQESPYINNSCIEILEVHIRRKKNKWKVNGKNC